MSDLQEDIAVGMEAEAILSSTAYIRAFEALEKDLAAQWSQSPVRDAEGREKLYLSLKLLQKVRINLDTLIQDAVMAQRRLDELNRPRTAMERVKYSLSSWVE